MKKIQKEKKKERKKTQAIDQSSHLRGEGWREKKGGLGEGG